jgi:phage shock protein A
MLTLAYVIGFVFCAVVIASAFAPKLPKKTKVLAFTARNAIEGAIDNPIQENRYDIEKAEKELIDYRHQLAKLIAANTRLKHEQEDAQGQADKYARLADRAAQAGNRGDVAEAIRQKNMHASRVVSITTELTKNDELISAINTNISNHQNRIDSAKIKCVQLETRLTNAELRGEMVATTLNTEGLNALDDLEKKVEEKESLVDATAQVFTLNTLETKYNDVEDDSEVEALMQKHTK